MDCGGGSCLSGSSYSSCDIKDGRKGSGDCGRGGGGDEGGSGGGSMGDRLSFCLGVRTITLIAVATPTSVPKVELVLRTGEQADENRAYEEKDEHFDEENLCEACERFVHDIRETAGERAGTGGRIWGVISTLAAVVQERGSLRVWWGGEWAKEGENMS